MIYENTEHSRRLNTVVGSIVFFIIIAGGTYVLQSTLVLVKWANIYFHWSVVLLGLPVLAGLSQRYLRIEFPLSTVMFGALASTVMLYPLYSQQFWAVPPTVVTVLVYLLIIVGTGFFASLPITTVYAQAFHRGKYKKSGSRAPKKTTKKATRKNRQSFFQRMGFQTHRDMIAMIEFLVGIFSLVLTIFSIFFLGQN